MKSAIALSWDDISEGMEIALPIRVTAEDMQQFAHISGDYNPLHTDRAFARSKGHADNVVYGALLIAYVSRLVGMHLPGRDCVLAALDVKFSSPLLVDEEATLSATVKQKHEAVRLVELAFRIATPAKAVAAGIARVLLR